MNICLDGFKKNNKVNEEKDGQYLEIKNEKINEQLKQKNNGTREYK